MTEKKHAPKKKPAHKKAHHKKKRKKTKKEPSREQEQERLMEEGLEAIYGSEEIDFSTLEHDQQRITKLLIRIVIGLGLLASAAWSGFFVFMNYVNPPREETFALEIVADDLIVSGEQTTIEILYSNPTTVPIAALSVDVNLPSSFIIEQTNQDPTDADQLIWDLGQLTGLSDDRIVIEGTWIADVPSETPIQAYASYRPGNFNSEFEEIAVQYVSSVESTVTIDVEGPEELPPGDIGEYTIVVNNDGQYAFDAVDILLDLPDGFYLESSEPALEPGAAPSWTIEALEAQEERLISFSGSFAADIEGFQYFDTSAVINVGDRELAQAAFQNYTDVLQSAVAVTLAANGTTETVTIDQDRTMRASLSLEQSDEESIEDYSVLLSFEGDGSFPIDWSAADLDGGTLTSDGIVWDAQDIGPLLLEQKTILNLSLPIEEIDSGDLDTFSFLAIVETQNGSVRSSPIDVYVNSEATLSTVIRYYDEEGQVLGSGPMPPTVDELTQYRVYWSIENDLHTLQDIRVSTTLPPDVSWSDSTNADLGTISYDESTNTVSWNISELSTAITYLEAHFTVGITPEQEDVGSFVKLTSSTNLIATDTTTKAQLQRSQDGLTTEAPDDDFAIGQGIVVE